LAETDDSQQRPKADLARPNEVSEAQVPGLAACSRCHKYLGDKDVSWAKLANEKPKGETIANDTRLNACNAGKAR